jgi:hypothetical protein
LHECLRASLTSQWPAVVACNHDKKGAILNHLLDVGVHQKSLEDQSVLELHAARIVVHDVGKFVIVIVVATFVELGWVMTP